MHWLTVDQGNSSLDAVWFEGQDAPRPRASWRGLSLGGLPEVAAELEGVEVAVSFSSVCSAAARAELEAELRGLFGSGETPAPGLELSLADPSGVGHDRLFAARAAWELSTAPAVLVVDVGTAMTVDLVREGVFMGGAIAPGPRLLAAALERGGAQLFEVEPLPGAAALGRDTRGALAAGIVVGLRGAARALAEGQLAELGSGPACEVLVTGGGRELLLEPEGFLPGHELIEVDLLVHLGLLLAGRGLAQRSLAGGLDGFAVRHRQPS